MIEIESPEPSGTYDVIAEAMRKILSAGYKPSDISHEERLDLVEKWNRYGLLDGIDFQRRIIVALLLENESKMLKEKENGSQS